MIKKSEEKKKKISIDDTASIAAEDYARNLFAKRPVSAQVDTDSSLMSAQVDANTHPISAVNNRSSQSTSPTESSQSTCSMRSTKASTGKLKRKNKINPCADHHSIASSIFFEKSEDNLTAVGYSDAEESAYPENVSKVAESGNELNLSTTSFSGFGKYEKKVDAELKEEDILVAQQFMYALAKVRLYDVKVKRP